MGDAIKQVDISVCCLTYNHEKYVRQALESIINQTCTYSIEILINDDASTDQTASIIKEFELKYPNTIKPIYQSQNQRSKIGGGMNPTFNFNRARGRYLAFCEGDDYWVSPDKLQNQVDFLERNYDYGAVVTDYNKVNDNGDEIISNFLKSYYSEKSNRDLKLKSFFRSEIKRMRTITSVIRKKSIDDLIIKGFLKNCPGDTQIFTHLICTSKVHLFLDTSSSYRILKESVSHTKSYQKKQNFLNSYIRYMEYAVVFYKMKNSEKRYLKKTKKLSEIRDAAHHRNKKKLWFYILLLLFTGSFSRNIITNIKFAYRK